MREDKVLFGEERWGGGLRWGSEQGQGLHIFLAMCHFFSNSSLVSIIFIFPSIFVASENFNNEVFSFTFIHIVFKSNPLI